VCTYVKSQHRQYSASSFAEGSGHGHVTYTKMEAVSMILTLPILN